ncbi:phage holin family protein [Erythrobacter sp. T5W1-R]|uniref:phage holin family protein n=1 Tax=Erythrobacter sp. T5W1-R TaxID=3101752 RepID=UPI002AFF4ACF|nr:phage holin family protein [Erythrobacter sp. T5W1-R]MEA1619659.1 phage holin family protein [Erythrobacter sp. T5W1-R]
MRETPQGGPDAAQDDTLPDEALSDEETSLSADIAALIDSGRTYAEAELAFQKTRAALAGDNAAKAIGALVVALVLLNIALTALAIGAVLALQPLITIWGAIAVVVGALLLGAGLLARSAKARGKLLGVMFGEGSGQ